MSFALPIVFYDCYNNPMKPCKVCKLIGLLLGKKFIMPLLGHHYPLCYYAQVKRDLKGLNLQVVGGLVTRGWTTNDVDVIGDRADAPTLNSRLHQDGIPEPVHYCGRIGEKHSHLKCAYFGIKMALTGKGY